MMEGVCEMKESTEISDEIKKRCRECQAERMVAYWDEELDCYIYLTESVYCLACEEKLDKLLKVRPNSIQN